MFILSSPFLQMFRFSSINSKATAYRAIFSDVERIGVDSSFELRSNELFRNVFLLWLNYECPIFLNVVLKTLICFETTFGNCFTRLIHILFNLEHVITS